MSWLSKKWDQLSGKNQKVGLGTINREYDEAFQGARDAYGNLQDTGEQMMDAGSQLNLNRKAQMEASAADASAEGARQAQRLAAMGGGGNTASLAAQTMESGNKAQAGAIGAFNQYLQGAMGQGAGLVSQSANNMAQMNQTQMNAVANQRLANARLDSQATGMGASMLGSVLGNVVAPGIGGKIGAGIGKMFAQEGDYVDKLGSYNRFALESGEEAMNMKDILRYKAMSSQEGSSPEMWDAMGERGQRYMRDAMLTKALKQEDLAPEDSLKLVEKLSKAGRKLHSSGLQKGGAVESPYGNSGGMLSQVMGPDGIPMNVRTRIGGQYVG